MAGNGGRYGGGFYSITFSTVTVFIFDYTIALTHEGRCSPCRDRPEEPRTGQGPRQGTDKLQASGLGDITRTHMQTCYVLCTGRCRRALALDLALELASSLTWPKQTTLGAGRARVIESQQHSKPWRAFGSSRSWRGTTWGARDWKYWYWVLGAASQCHNSNTSQPSVPHSPVIRPAPIPTYLQPRSSEKQ